MSVQSGWFWQCIINNNKSLVSHVAARCVKPQTNCVNKQQSSQSLFPACCDPGPVQILDTGAWHWLGGYLIDKRARRGIHTYAHCLDASPRRRKSKLSSYHRRTWDSLWSVNSYTVGKVRCFYVWLTNEETNKCIAPHYLCICLPTYLYVLCIGLHLSNMSCASHVCWGGNVETKRTAMGPECVCLRVRARLLFHTLSLRFDKWVIVCSCPKSPNLRPCLVSVQSVSREASLPLLHESDWVKRGVPYPI